MTEARRGDSFSWPAFGPAPAEDPAAAEAAAERGYREGYEAGRQQAAEEVAALRGRLEQGLAALDAARTELVLDQHRAITGLVFRALEALLKVELASNPLVLDNLLEEALAVLGREREAVRVHVNPEDFQALQAVTELELTADELVPEAGVSVQVPELTVEFDLLGELRRARTELADD